MVERGMKKHIQDQLKTKQKIEKNKETVRPTVINDPLIAEYMIEYNRENKIFDDDDREIWELTHLSLSFKNIVEIDNLTGMGDLIKLQLDNNIITEIAGLENLTKLKWLDLSFNMIEQIKGLDNLRELEDLSLFSNRITVLEGLDNLEQLNVLSVGLNEIADLEGSVKYLHKLRNNLEVLKIKDNAFRETSEKEYKSRIIAYLSKLKYLDYELIEIKEREKAEGEYKTELESMNLDTDDNAGTEQKQQLEELKEAHIHYTQNLFQKCCEAFENYDIIANFQKYKDAFSYVDPNIEEIIGTFQQAIKSKQRDKKNKLRFCDNKMRQAERKAETTAITAIQAYKKKEKHVLRDVHKRRHENDGADHTDYYQAQEEKLADLILTLKGDLLDIEMALQQTLDVARNQYFAEIKKINEDMHGLQTEAFQSITSEFAQFSLQLKDLLNKEKESFIQKIETDEQSALEEYGVTDMEQTPGTALETILDDNKDAVDELVTLFIEKVEGEANQIDTLILKGRNNEWSKKQTELAETQHTRGREIISEIIQTTNSFQNNIMNKFQLYRDEDEDAV